MRERRESERECERERGRGERVREGEREGPPARLNIQTEIVNGERLFFIFNRFPRGHYLVWWVRVMVSLGVKVRVSVEVRVRVRVSNFLGSG